MNLNEIIDNIKTISHTGWIPNYRQSCTGDVGNIFEDKLGVIENNLPIADIGEYELKTQKVKLQSSSLLSLFCSEPSSKTIPTIVREFGWKPTKWRSHYVENEKSFRQTITSNFTDRGFRINITDSKVIVEFNPEYATNKDRIWVESVRDKKFPELYWTFDEIEVRLRKKLKNCIYTIAASTDRNGTEHFNYCSTTIMEGFNFDNFLTELKSGNILVDFNARTGHNHGTRFRCRQNIVQKLYTQITYI